MTIVHYRHLIPAPLDRTSANAWLYKHPGTTCQRNNPSTSMTHVHVACEKSYVQLWGHSCIHTQETRLQSDMQSYIMTGPPTHWVQELNVSTVIIVPRRDFCTWCCSSKMTHWNVCIFLTTIANRELYNTINITELHVHGWICLTWLLGRNGKGIQEYRCSTKGGSQNRGFMWTVMILIIECCLNYKENQYSTTTGRGCCIVWYECTYFYWNWCKIETYYFQDMF